VLTPDVPYDAVKLAGGKLKVTLAAGVQCRGLISVSRNIPYHSIFSVSAESINNL
jgi:hypothetical protein